MKYRHWMFVAFTGLVGCTTAGSPRTETPATPTAGSTTQAGTASVAPIIEERVIRSLADVASLVSTLDPKRTLVAIDIDDTVLTSATDTAHSTRQFFGSDAWYTWQDQIGESGAGRVNCLFDVVGMNYELSTQEPTQPDAAAIVNGISAPKLFITSRSANYRGSTERELQRAQIALPGNLTAAEGAAFRHDGKALRVYANGILMTQGGNKGKLLIHLLTTVLAIPDAFDTIVLVDDTNKHIQTMKEAVQGTQRMSYYGLRYIGIKDDVGSAGSPPYVVTPEQKAQAAKSWTDWLGALKLVAPQRYDRIMRKECGP